MLYKSGRAAEASRQVSSPTNRTGVAAGLLIFRLQCEKISDHVDQIILGHVSEQIGGHEGDGALFARSDILLDDLGVLGVGVAEGDVIGRFLDDQAGELEAVLRFNDPREILIGDGFAGEEDRFEEVLAAGFLADGRKVRADLAADARDIASSF
jgi:hypothetical protein